MCGLVMMPGRSLSLDAVGDDPMPRRGWASLRSREVVAIQVHHLGPGSHEVPDELRLRVRASVDLRQGPELGVRAEHEIDAQAQFVRSEEHTSELQSR